MESDRPLKLLFALNARMQLVSNAEGAPENALNAKLVTYSALTAGA